MTKEEYLEYFKEEVEREKKWVLSPMEWDDIVQHAYEAVFTDKMFTMEELTELFPELLK